MKIAHIVIYLGFVLIGFEAKSQTLKVNTDSLQDFALLAEMPLEQMRYDKSTGIMYAFTRDTINFYAYARISDETLQRQVMRRGLIFWIDSTGRKKQHFGMKYPVVNRKQPRQDHQNIAGTDNEARPGIPDFESLNELVVYGLSGAKVPDYLFIPNNLGFMASAKINAYGILYIKYVLPLNYLGTGFKLSLGFELAGFDKEKGFENQMPIKAQMNAGGMQMNAGGGGRKGGGGGRMNHQSDGAALQNQTLKFWIKNVVLY